MKLYQGDSCNRLYISALKDCLAVNSPTPSRVGMVYDLGPVAFELTPGRLNLLTLNKRALNPFFAIAEAAWVVGGLNSLDTLNYYLKTYDSFSDDGVSLNGAYGYRLRNHFGYDQLEFVIKELKTTPDSRRCILNMYSPDDLINNTSKDIPCNTSIMIKIRNGALDFTVTNRSNDIHWGVPYNFFVFQVLHCYLAQKIGVEVGYQRHFTDSLHLYERDIAAVTEVLKHSGDIFDTESDKTLDLVYMILAEIENINQKKFSCIQEKSLREAYVNYEQFRCSKSLFSFENKTGNAVLDFLTSDWLSKYAKE
ncbi:MULTISPECIES: thymidylate synthase [Vibrio]|uniref:thymidylate synthase n=1 Tax=Vibrio tasmaniensis TaxID=212663 RepID=A0A2N7NF49_9VIBR|nr:MULTISPECIES: thymidylate synthase [Vibrio]PMP11766.1 thymidylate synthase [Vibrio tasmaniensis]PTP73545.1 thymidylate synthase [Vibrio splendidus]TKG26558.1 thymidylate synthase [Vibrio tasmaniensis]TKG37562.1 thymidylate synthase [Vibrio tasmaniensis]TKG42242.1 thymidylate synthase [Vibrio tasmaniensis]